MLICGDEYTFNIAEEQGILTNKPQNVIEDTRTEEEKLRDKEEKARQNEIFEEKVCISTRRIEFNLTLIFSCAINIYSAIPFIRPLPYYGDHFNLRGKFSWLLVKERAFIVFYIVMATLSFKKIILE